MIHTAKQLKDKVKNMSGGNSEVAQALIREHSSRLDPRMIAFFP